MCVIWCLKHDFNRFFYFSSIYRGWGGGETVRGNSATDGDRDLCTTWGCRCCNWLARVRHQRGTFGKMHCMKERWSCQQSSKRVQRSSNPFSLNCLSYKIYNRRLFFMSLILEHDIYICSLATTCLSNPLNFGHKLNISGSIKSSKIRLKCGQVDHVNILTK